MRPSLNDLKTQSFELISSQTGPQKKPRFSVTRIISNAIAATILSLYIYADNLASGLLPDSAKSVVLERWAAIFGVSRKRASIASGEVLIESTQFTQVVKGTLMQDDLGNQYATTERQILGQETKPVKVESVETGRNKNQPPGTILTLVNPITGIISSIEVGGAGLTGAADVESDDEFRVRILDRIKNPPRGGSIRDYEAWALEVPGVTRAWAFSNYQGRSNAVGVTFVLDNQEDIIPIEESEKFKEVDFYLKQRAPIGAEVNLFVPIEFEVRPRIRVRPDTPKVRFEIEQELRDFFFRNAGVGDGETNRGTILISQLRESISLAEGETDNELLEPTENIEVVFGQLAVVVGVDFIE